MTNWVGTTVKVAGADEAAFPAGAMVKCKAGFMGNRTCYIN
jgi:hypothetical protein